MRRAAPRALIFDLDGTLVDTVPTRISAWLAAFEEFHIPADRKQVAALIGSDGRRLARIVAEAAGLPLDDVQAELVDRRAGDIYNVLNVGPRPLPGATDLLNLLITAGRSWAIATSSLREQVYASIRALSLAADPIVIDGSDVRQAKPAPDLLLVAAERLQVDPALTWCVGDSIWDMQAASAARMPGIGVTTGAASAQELAHAGAWWTIGSLLQLIPTVDPSHGA